MNHLDSSLLITVRFTHWHVFLFVTAEQRAATQREQDLSVVLFFALWLGQSPHTVTATASSWLWSFFTRWLHSWIGVKSTRGGRQEDFCIVSRTVTSNQNFSRRARCETSEGRFAWWTDSEPWIKVICWSQERTHELQTRRGFLGTLTLAALVGKITHFMCKFQKAKSI